MARKVKTAVAVKATDEIPALRTAAPPPAKAVAFVEKVEIFEEVEQGSEEWFELRLGMVTASNFSKVLARGEDKVRSKFMRQLAGELLTGEPAETYKNAAMQRGNEMEAELRETYAYDKAVEPKRIGFARRSLARGYFVGCSPDSLIGKNGVLEIKSMLPDLIIELLQTGRFPSQHKAQCQGTLWVLGRDTIDLRIGYRRFPNPPTWTMERDENYIRELSEEVERFHYELRRMVADVKGRG